MLFQQLDITKWWEKYPFVYFFQKCMGIIHWTIILGDPFGPWSLLLKCHALVLYCAQKTNLQPSKLLPASTLPTIWALPIVTYFLIFYQATSGLTDLALTPPFCLESSSADLVWLVSSYSLFSMPLLQRYLLWPLSFQECEDTLLFPSLIFFAALMTTGN